MQVAFVVVRQCVSASWTRVASLPGCCFPFALRFPALEIQFPNSLPSLRSPSEATSTTARALAILLLLRSTVATHHSNPT